VLDFRILGPLQVLDDAGVVGLGSRDQRVLLARLLLEPGRFVPLEQVIAAVGRVATRSEVGACISELRRTLGAEVVEQARGGCRLRIRPGQIDVDRFRVLVEGADRGPPAEREQRLRHALALWRGPVLADFAGEPFAQAFIAELDELKRATEARLAQF
jgi:DNA-binding SARP family transcriptional activator